ncbi:hypothetical protein JXB01_04615 [Candidatus Micrarchaeota archaeon]|nr:hypothetical protein [Candidatus Micrarchaeota archaeon]
MDFEDDMSSINTELRYITVELMKIAEKNGKTFEEVSREYIENVKLLHGKINSLSEQERQSEACKKSLSK